MPCVTKLNILSDGSSGHFFVHVFASNMRPAHTKRQAFLTASKNRHLPICTGKHILYGVQMQSINLFYIVAFTQRILDLLTMMVKYRQIHICGIISKDAFKQLLLGLPLLLYLRPVLETYNRNISHEFLFVCSI